jgi:GntR family transcriptional regulator, transcriptional repressor for pyruvate dehydrogenase complex
MTEVLARGDRGSSHRLSDELADRLLDAIREQGLQPGDRLPSERELGEQFGVSRTVVREAVRNLAGRNVVRTRRGASPTVAAFPASAVTSSMSLYLRGQSRDVSYEKVHEVRVAIETEMAAHAARRASHVGVAHLREQHEAIGALIAAGENIAAADLEFHRELARIADNPLFLAVLDSVVDLLFDVRQATLMLPEAPELAHTLHGTILEAVADRNAEGARLAMRHHLDVVLDLWMRSHAARLTADGGAGGAPPTGP